MKEKKDRQIKMFAAGLLVILIIGGSALILINKPGTITVPSTDPETGLQNWIEAVNARNIDRVYDLAPDEIKQQVSLDQFRKDNMNNTLLQPGEKFLNFSIYDRKQNGTYAQITAQVFLQQTPGKNSLGPEVPMQYKFALFFQHGEWKIWTVKFT